MRTYLNLVAEEVAALQRERDALDQEVSRPARLIEEHRQRETILKNTLLTAQRVSEEIKENARKQAEAWSRKRRCRPTGCSSWPRPRPRGRARILDLRAQRSALRTDIRALITRLSQILDLQEEAELEDNLRFLKRREEAQ